MTKKNGAENGWTVEVVELISNFISHFTRQAITYTYSD